MAVTTSSRAGTASSGAGQVEQPVPPVDDRDYINPGVFITPWPNVLMVEDMDLQRHIGDLQSVEVPWESLATLKVHAPEMSRDIIIVGWAGAADIIRRLEGLVLRDLRHGIRRK